MNFNEALEQDWDNNVEAEIDTDNIDNNINILNCSSKIRAELKAHQEANMKFFIPSCQTTMSQRMEAVEMPETKLRKNSSQASEWSKAGDTTLSVLGGIFKVFFFIIKWFFIGVFLAMAASAISKRK